MLKKKHPQRFKPKGGDFYIGIPPKILRSIAQQPCHVDMLTVNGKIIKLLTWVLFVLRRFRFPCPLCGCCWLSQALSLTLCWERISFGQPEPVFASFGEA